MCDSVTDKWEIKACTDICQYLNNTVKIIKRETSLK